MTMTDRLTARGCLPNPDHVWGDERTFADIINDLGKRHDRHVEGIKALDAKLEAWSARIDAISEAHHD